MYTSANCCVAFSHIFLDNYFRCFFIKTVVEFNNANLHRERFIAEFKSVWEKRILFFYHRIVRI